MAVAEGPTGVRGFARLAVTYTANDLGDQIGLVALAVLVFDQTNSALAPAALFLVARSIPALLAPPLQASLDRHPTRRVLPAVYLAEALAFAALAVLAHHFSLAAVLAIAFADGVLALTGRAITRSTLALILRPHSLLREGNNIINLCFSVSNMVGPVVGGIVVAVAGPAWGLAIDAALFLVMAGVMAWRAQWPSPAKGDTAGWRARLRAGLSYARATPGVGSLIAADGLSIIPLCLVVPILVVYAKDTLGTGDAGYGLLQGSWGAGIVLGSVLLLRFRRGSLRNIIATGLLAVGVSYVGIGISPVIVLACLASVVGGVGNGIESITLITAVQTLVPDEFMGRVSSLMESVAACAMGIGFAIGGVITDVFDPRVTYVASGIAVLLCVPVVARAVRTEHE
jgi:MFS family permease